MFKNTKAYSSFSTNNIETAKTFYGELLGLNISEENGILTLELVDGGRVLIYPKGDAHEPATFTVLNFTVNNIDEVVEELRNEGITFETYDNEYIKTDEKGISRSSMVDVAWFKDPAGNILSVLQEK